MKVVSISDYAIHHRVGRSVRRENHIPLVPGTRGTEVSLENITKLIWENLLRKDG